MLITNVKQGFIIPSTSDQLYVHAFYRVVTDRLNDFKTKITFTNMSFKFFVISFGNINII